MTENKPPVIVIEGPAGCGKGTTGRRLSSILGFHYLDTGAIYRVFALAALSRSIPLDDDAALAALAPTLQIVFDGERVLLDGICVNQSIRTEAIGNAASIISALLLARSALTDRQRAFRQYPGLVADGRGLSHSVFEDAATKIFITADIQVRAERRFADLVKTDPFLKLDDVARQLQMRDDRDMNRSVAPLAPHPDSVILDASHCDAEEIAQQALRHYLAHSKPFAITSRATNQHNP